MKENKEKFKQFVIEQLKDYDEWREASPDGYAEIITDEAVKLFCQHDVSNSVCSLSAYEHNKSIFHLGQCHKCYSKITREQIDC